MPRFSVMGRLFVAIMALSLGSSSSDAQAPRRLVSVGLGGGGTVPIGDYASDAKTGWHGGGYLQYEPVNNIWGVRGESWYNRAGYTEEFFGATGTTPDDGAYNSTLYVGAAAVLLGKKRDGGITPYLLGGLGAYRLTASLTDSASSIQTSLSVNGFGFSGGAGVRFGRGTGMFIEARYHQYRFTDDGVSTSYAFIPVTLGIRF